MASGTGDIVVTNIKLTCENCAESAGMVDDEFVWCKEEGGIVGKEHRCFYYTPQSDDEPDIVDHWPADNTD